MQWLRAIWQWYLDHYNLVRSARSISGGDQLLDLRSLYEEQGPGPPPPPAPFFLPSQAGWLLTARRNGRR